MGSDRLPVFVSLPGVAGSFGSPSLGSREKSCENPGYKYSVNIPIFAITENLVGFAFIMHLVGTLNESEMIQCLYVFHDALEK